MDVDGDQHEPNIEPEIESSKMQDRGGADFGFHSLLIHNNNCDGPDESDEDLFDSDDGFCSVDDDAVPVAVGMASAFPLASAPIVASAPMVVEFVLAAAVVTAAVRMSSL